MTRVCLVRHGETDWNLERRLQGREDVPLNERGREQARLCARCLSDRKWDAVVSSPLMRAAETARIVAEHLGIEHVETMHEFVERDYGVSSGMTIMERDARFPDRECPSLEPRESVRERCMSGLAKVARRYPGQNVVVASHGAAINSVLAAISGGEIGSGKTVLENACLSELCLDAEGWRVESFNVVSHLS